MRQVIVRHWKAAAALSGILATLSVATGWALFRVREPQEYQRIQIGMSVGEVCKILGINCPIGPFSQRCEIHVPAEPSVLLPPRIAHVVFVNECVAEKYLTHPSREEIWDHWRWWLDRLML